LRDALAEVGGEALTTELFAFETDETDETGDHGSLTFDHQVISCSVASLTVNV
jgi:hypothetical protein